MMVAFSQLVRHEDNNCKAMHWKLHPIDIAACLADMEIFFKTSKINDKAWFGLLRNEAMKHVDPAQYVFLRVASAYESHNCTIRDNFCCWETFRKAHIKTSEEKSEKPHVKRILRRPKQIVESLEKKREDRTS